VTMTTRPRNRREATASEVVTYTTFASAWSMSATMS